MSLDVVKEFSEGRRADRKSQRAPALALGCDRESPAGLGCDTSNLKRGRDRLTDDTMAPRTLLEKSPDADLLRDMIGFAKTASREILRRARGPQRPAPV